MDFLALPGNGSVEPAEYILHKYQTLFGKNLEISVNSLAIEILIHTYIDKFAQRSKHLTRILPAHIAQPFLRFLEITHEKTSAIDCGERPMDHNRFLFNDLAPFHSVIFAALGKSA
jgi:hypothetical protein